MSVSGRADLAALTVAPDGDVFVFSAWESGARPLRVRRWVIDR